jgi:HEAT repeat protein
LLPLLIEASHAPESATRLVAASGLAKYAHETALRRICELARTDPEATVQHAAIELLSENAEPLATQTLLELLGSEPVAVRALEGLGRRADERLPQLSAALTDATSTVAEGVVAVVTRLPAALSEPMLLGALRSLNERARRAAVKALRIAFDSESVNAELARVAGADSDPEVRRVALARLS